MFQHLIVPIDGSAASWEAVPVAARMAEHVDGKLDLVTVVDRLADVRPARTELEHGIDRLGPLPIEPMPQILANDSVAQALADHLDAMSGSMIVMSSHGHGRTAAVLGSTADELLRLTFGPIVVVGPHAVESAGALGGDYVVPVDGSESAEKILPIAEAWAVEFTAVPWIVEVIKPQTHRAGDVIESAYPSRLAHELHAETGHEVEFEVLHGDRPSAAIVEFADRMGASFIFACTHGRTGLERLRLGSVSAELVRHATCPVVLHRPPHLSD